MSVKTSMVEAQEMRSTISDLETVKCFEDLLIKVLHMRHIMLLKGI